MNTSQLRKIIREEVSTFLKENPSMGTDNRVGDDASRPNVSAAYLFTVKNDEEGRERIKRAKEAMSDLFRFRLRGRHHDRKQALGTKWKSFGQNDVPLEKAEYIAVYADPKN